ncbi:MAG: YggT family protein [Gemmatimonadota bacterium]
MEDDKVAADEARRVAQHGATTSAVERDVNDEIAESSERHHSEDRAKLEGIASDMRGDAMDEVAGTSRQLGRARGTARVSQVVDYAFGLIYGLLAIRLVLMLIAANSSNAFVQFIDTVTNPFYALFRGIVDSPTAEGGYTLAVPIIIAIIVYALLHAAINGLLRMMVHRKTTV